MRYLLLLLASGSLQAASVDVEVRDGAGAPVADAVAYALPKAPVPLRKRDVEVAQIDRQFVPLVTVVQTGTPVQFPNRDPIRHHVYSFSPPKPFELKLYAGTPAAPVVFDKPGEVVLGLQHPRPHDRVRLRRGHAVVREDRQGRQGAPRGPRRGRLRREAVALAQALPAPEPKPSSCAPTKPWPPHGRSPCVRRATPQRAARRTRAYEARRQARPRTGPAPDREAAGPHRRLLRGAADGGAAGELRPDPLHDQAHRGGDAARASSTWARASSGGCCEQNSQQLVEATSVLTYDFGFREAIATRDRDTILSALAQPRRRASRRAAWR